MQEDMRNKKTSRQPETDTCEQRESVIDGISVNDDPAQILDVVTITERESAPRGAEIDVSCFVYDAPTSGLSSDAFDQLLADAEEEVRDMTSKERDVHEHTRSDS